MRTGNKGTGQPRGFEAAQSTGVLRLGKRARGRRAVLFWAYSDLAAFEVMKKQAAFLPVRVLFD